MPDPAMKALAVEGKRPGPSPRPSPLGRPSGLLSSFSAAAGAPGGVPKSGSAADLRTMDFKPSQERMDRNRSAMVPGMRKWLKFERSGRTEILQVDKHAIALQTGVQLRDLRLLDPALATSYPSAILARDSALVVNLEYIKCIITTDYVLVLNPEDEHSVTFIEEMQRRLAQQAAPDAKGGGRMTSSQSSPNLTTQEATADGNGAASGSGGMTRAESTDLLDAADTPFELRVLEVALDVVRRDVATACDPVLDTAPLQAQREVPHTCGHLERQAADLEATAHPALDALTRVVTTSTLERVRRVKSRMVRLSTRVETLKEVLQKYLDDDADMKDLNLSAKFEEALQRASSLQRRSLDASMMSPAAGPGEPREPPSPMGFLGEQSDDDDVNEVEMLLEAYFIQIDNTHNKLQTLHEYIDDTEARQDYINIELDSHRNQLIQLELLLTAAMFAMALVTVVAGLFGMNLYNKAENSYVAFILVITISVTGATAVFIGIILYCRYKRLMCY